MDDVQNANTVWIRGSATVDVCELNSSVLPDAVCESDNSSSEQKHCVTVERGSASVLFTCHATGKVRFDSLNVSGASDTLLGEVRHYHDINMHRAPGYA